MITKRRYFFLKKAKFAQRLGALPPDSRMWFKSCRKHNARSQTSETFPPPPLQNSCARHWSRDGSSLKFFLILYFKTFVFIFQSCRVALELFLLVFWLQYSLSYLTMILTRFLSKTLFLTAADFSNLYAQNSLRNSDIIDEIFMDNRWSVRHIAIRFLWLFASYQTIFTNILGIYKKRIAW